MQTLMSLICRYVNSVDVIINIILDQAPPAYLIRSSFGLSFAGAVLEYATVTTKLPSYIIIMRTCNVYSKLFILGIFYLYVVCEAGYQFILW